MTKFISINKDTQEKKETVFTHYLELSLDNPILSKAKYKPIDFDKVEEVYTIKNKTLFRVTLGGSTSYWIGTKGDEFN